MTGTVGGSRTKFITFEEIENIKNTGLGVFPIYQVGVYAPRYICSHISDLGLAKYSFVADMSSECSCNLGYLIPENWAFDQFYELKGNEQFNSTPSFDLNKVGYSGRDKGISNFDEVPYLSPD